LDWIPYLSSTIRLLDLADSRHEPGTEPIVLETQRASRNDGYWLDIGITILELLREADIDRGEVFVPIKSLHADCQKLGLARPYDDLVFVARFLSTPTELFYCDVPPGENLSASASTKRTALIERSRNAEAVRLSAAGRTACAFAKHYQDFAYTGNEADKILTAIQWSQFSKVPEYVGNISQQVRKLATDIRRVRDQVGTIEVAEGFLNNRDRYMETLDHVHKAIKDAEDKLSEPATRASFLAWQENPTNADSDLTLEALATHLERVYPVLERFSREFAQLIDDLHIATRSGAQVIRFDEVAYVMSLSKPSFDSIRVLIQQTGPWNLLASFPAPWDFADFLRETEVERQVEEVALEDAAESAPETRKLNFTEKHTEAIIAALKEGPLSLGKMMEKGWLNMDESATFGGLVGLYDASDDLGINGTLAIFLGAGSLEYETGGAMATHDVWLEWLDRENQIGRA